MTTNSGGSHGGTPVWDEKTSSFQEFEEKLRFYKLGTKKADRYLCASRVIHAMPPGSQQFKLCAKIEEDKLMAEDGSGLLEIVKVLSAKKVAMELSHCCPGNHCGTDVTLLPWKLQLC